jgi:hypothetical protein
MEIEANKKRYRYVKKEQPNTAPVKKQIKPSDLAKKVLLKGENLREFEELRAQVLEDLGPQSEIENILCEKIIFTQWKIRRAGEVERNLLNEENEITFEEKHPNSWDPPGRKRITNIDKVRMQSPEVQNIVNYQIEMEKVLQKLLSRLRSEQRLRQHGKNHEK